MNFYEFKEKLNELTAVGSQEPAMDKNSYLRLTSKLAQKLGEKSNKYANLVRYVARDPKMLSLLEQLIEETSLAQQGKVRNLFK